MRNRGIEIFLLPAKPPAPLGDGEPAPALEELRLMLGLEGLPSSRVSDSMAAVHTEVAAHAVRGHRRPPSWRELKRWARLLVLLCSRGLKFQQALRAAFNEVYVRSEVMAEARAAALGDFDSHCVETAAGYDAATAATRDLTLYRPAVWPCPLSVATFASDSALATMRRDASVLLLHLFRLGAADVASTLCSDGAELLVANLRSLSSCRDPQTPWALASALVPSVPLLELLSGQGALSSPGVGDAADGWAGLQCVLAAAQVFTERAAPAFAGDWGAYAASVLRQLQQASAQLFALPDGSAMKAACAAGTSGALQLVAELLRHPLVRRLADLHAQLATEARLPAAAAAVLAIDFSLAEGLQRFALAAGLQPSGTALKESTTAWQQAQALCSQMTALRRAVRAEAIVHSGSESAGAAVSDGSATLLQLSYWRFQHPKERAHDKAAHPVVDWLYPALMAIQAFEQCALQPGTAWSSTLAARVSDSVSVDEPFISTSYIPILTLASMVLQLAGVQEWRASLLELLHSGLPQSAPALLLAHLEELVFTWTHLRKALDALLELGSGSEEGARLLGAANQVDKVLGLAGAAASKPCLWKQGGRPLLPKTGEACAALAEVMALCDATRSALCS